MKRQSGFTLIEMMVAMGVALVALAATVFAFRDSAYTNQQVALKSDISDNLRAGMNFIQQDLIQAGTGIPVGGISIPNTGAAPGHAQRGVSALNRPTLTASGLEFPICNTTLMAVEPGDGLGNPISSPDATSVTRTDLITMLYVDNTLGLDNKPINQAPFGADPGCLGTISANGANRVVRQDHHISRRSQLRRSQQRDRPHQSRRLDHVQQCQRQRHTDGYGAPAKH